MNRAPDIERVARQGQRSRGRWFSLRSLPRGEQDGPARLAVRVPKRVERLSVRRNSTRRLVREVFRTVRARLASNDLLVAQTRRFEQGERPAVRLEVTRLLLGVECARH